MEWSKPSQLGSPARMRLDLSCVLPYWGDGYRLNMFRDD